jgi:inward rectifier potassium channel
VVKLGARRPHVTDLYHFLLERPWRWLLVAILAVYLSVNAAFAGLYLLGGDCLENARPGSFTDAFFFSVQTMATIGYGKMVPRTSYANALVTLEALLGMMSTAMATGMMFAKFARPSARVLFSRVAVVCERDGVQCLMFRMANERGNQLIEASLRLVLTRNETTREAEPVRRFYDLELQRSQNPTFALSWTAIHPLTPASALYGRTPEALVTQSVSIIASLVGIDETSGQTVHARHTYVADDLRWGMRFRDILSTLPDGRRQVDYTLFHDTQDKET